jgi:hypothetical protein
MGRVIWIVNFNLRCFRGKVHIVDIVGIADLLYRAVWPPSTARTIPVTILDAAEDK